MNNSSTFLGSSVYENFYNILLVIAVPAFIFALLMALIKEPKYRKWIRRKKKEHQILRKTWRKHPVGIIFGKDMLGRTVYSPLDSEPPQIGVFAPTGGGKTWSVLLMTLNSLANHIGGFIPDISGDIAPNIHADNVLVYAPENPETLKYNVFGVIDKESSDRDKSRMLEELALIFFPDREFKNGSERFFYEGGRDILIAALTAFYFQGLDFPEICRKIKYTDYNALFSEIAGMENDKATGLLSQFRNQKESDIGGCMGQAANAISLFANEDYLNKGNFGRSSRGETCVTADDINDKFVVLFIPRKMRDVYAPLNKLITKQVMQVADSRTIGQKPYCLIALDELSTLLKGSASVEDQLISSMQNIRKLNGRIIYLTQSIKDIDVYAGTGKREIIIDNTGFIVAMGAFDPDTKHFFAELVGKETLLHDGIEHQQYRLYPDDFSDLPDDKFYLIWRGGYMKLKKTFFFKEQIYVNR